MNSKNTQNRKTKLTYQIDNHDHLLKLFTHINRHLTIFEQATEEFAELDSDGTDQKNTDLTNTDQKTGDKIQLPEIYFEPLPEYFQRCLPKVKDVPTRMIGDLCAICQSNYLPGQKIYHLDCQHHFHQDCLEVWFKAHKYSLLVCPICRKDHSK